MWIGKGIAIAVIWITSYYAIITGCNESIIWGTVIGTLIVAWS